MKTITFDVEPTTQETLDGVKQRLRKKGPKNGLYNTLFHGYSNHIPITLRPDDIINNIASIWSKMIVLNAEKYRDFFVQHESKKFLEYISGGTYSDGRVPEFMDGMAKLIIEDQGDDKLTWATKAGFTTTQPDDRMVRSAAILASQKEFYEYGWTLLCGFPEIELAGTEEDWADLLSAVDRMPCPDDNLHKWKVQLLEIINKMVEGEEEFWQSCVTERPYGSGSQIDVSGWIIAFNPIDEKGKWLETIKDGAILDLLNEFEVKVNDNGHEFDLTVKSGPTTNILSDRLSVANKTKFFRSDQIVKESKPKLKVYKLVGNTGKTEEWLGPDIEVQEIK